MLSGDCPLQRDAEHVLGYVLEYSTVRTARCTCMDGGRYVCMRRPAVHIGDHHLLLFHHDNDHRCHHGPPKKHSTAHD